MGTLTVSRKQRLRTLEKEIRKASEEVHNTGLRIGQYLCEIRDEELWAEDGYGTWADYLRDRAHELVGRSFSRSAELVRAAEIHRRLPETIKTDVRFNLTPDHLVELGRLAPNKSPQGPRGAPGKEFAALRKQDVTRVLCKAGKLAGDGSVSVRVLRRAVDEDLGIDRVAKAKATKAKDNRPELRRWIDQQTGTIEGILEALQQVPDDGWSLLSESDPQLVERFTTACDSLAAFLRKALK